MSRRRQRVLQFLGSLFACSRALCSLSILAFLMVVLYLATLGFPPWVVRKIEERLHFGDMTVHARIVRIAPPFALVMKDVRVYPRHVLGPPVVEARRLQLGFSPVLLAHRQFPLEEVTISDGVFRTEMLPSQPAAPAVTSVATPVTVHATLRNCVFQGMTFELLDGTVRVTGTAVEVRDAKGALQHAGLRGTFDLNATYDRASQALAGGVKTRCDPHLLVPIMRAMDMSFARELTERFKFGSEVPKTDLQFERTPGPGGALRVAGTFQCGAASYVKVPFREVDGGLDMTFSSTSSVVRVQPLRILRGEGEATGGFTVTISDSVGRVDFDAVSSMHPEALLRMIGLVGQEATVPYHFEAPFRMSARGTADFRGMTNTLFTGKVACGGIGIDMLPVRDCSFDLAMEGSTCRCENVTGTLYGGNLAQTVEIRFPCGSFTDTVYKASGTLARADFETCVRELVKEKTREFRGTLSGTFDLTGYLDDPGLRRLTGTGSVRIKDGRVFMLPVFGGLSKYLTRMIPGLGVLIGQSEVKTSFTLADGKAATEKILIEGDVLSLSGRGSYGFDGALDFDVQVRLMKEHELVAKLLRVLTYPISRLFEFRLCGQLSDPKWYPINFSTDLLERIGLVDEARGEPGRGPAARGDAGAARGK